jgi:hypothetical protein
MRGIQDTISISERGDDICISSAFRAASWLMMACYVRRMAGLAWTARTSGNVYGQNRAREARLTAGKPDRTQRGRAPCACGGRGSSVINLES